MVRHGHRAFFPAQVWRVYRFTPKRFPSRSAPYSCCIEFIALRLETSKTDQFRRSHTLFSGHSKSDICPVYCLQTLIRHYNPSSHDYNTTPLFTLQDGSPLTLPCLLSFSSSRLRMLGIDPTLFGGHSFRIGGATSTANAGIPDHLIKTIGRWSWDCYQRCIRTPLNSVISVSETLAKPPTVPYVYASPTHLP